MSEIAPYKSRNRIRLERDILRLERKLNALRDRLKEADKMPGLGTLMALVCLHTETTSQDIKGTTRKRQIVDIRQVFIHIAVDVYGYGRKEVGRYINRDHSTINYSLESYHSKVFNQEFRVMAGTVEHNVRIGVRRGILHPSKKVS